MTQLVDDLDAQASDELRALRHEVEHLRRALSSRAQIDQAKGILMLRYGISAERAFDVLVRWSQQANVKLRIVAVALLRIAEGAQAPESDDAGVDLSWLAAQLRSEQLHGEQLRGEQLHGEQLHGDIVPLDAAGNGHSQEESA